MNFEVIKKDARTAAIYEYNRGVGRKFYIKTFGCQQNEADSEKIAGILLSLGYAEAAEAESADLIILNTCSVRAHAEDKAFSTLGAFRALKRKREELIVGVVGCMGANSVAVDKLKRDFHYVSFTLGAGAMHKLPEALYSVIFEGKRFFIPPKERESIVEGIPTRRSSAKSAFVSIMYGCDNFCSYCIVPYTRGRERSRQSEEIIKECR